MSPEINNEKAYEGEIRRLEAEVARLTKLVGRVLDLYEKGDEKEMRVTLLNEVRPIKKGEPPAPQPVTGEMLNSRFGDTSHFTDKPAPRTKTSFGTEIGQHHESIVMGIPKNPAPNAPDIHDTPWLFGHQTLGHPDGKAGEPCPCDTCPKEAKCHFDSIAATKRGCAIYAEWDKRRSGAPLKRADDIYDDLDEALREDGRTEERRSG